MVCGACERRVDPSRSFCTNCGSSVFLDEREARSRSAWTARGSAPPASTPSTFLESLQERAKSLQASGKTIQDSARRAQESAKSLDRAAAARRVRARAATVKKAAPSFSLAPLVKFVIFALIVWNVGKWLLAIPEVLVLADRVQAGHFSDTDLQAARDAIGARIQTFLRNAQDPNPPPARSQSAEQPPPAPSPAPAPVTVTARSDRAVSAPPDDADVPPGVSLPGDEVTLPRVAHQQAPRYTAEALRARIEGTVVLQAVVRTHGVPTDISVVRSLDARLGLDQQAVAALREWRFAPGQRAGHPVPVLVQIEMRFEIP